MRAFVVISVLVAPLAWGGAPKATTGHNEAQADASSFSASGAAAGADATSIAEGGAGIGIGEGGVGVAMGGDSGGNVLSTQFSSRSRALGLALSGQEAAPAVGGHRCLVHLPGWGGASIGRTGKTEIDEECFAFEKCVAFADRLASWGQPRLAYEQLKACGAVEGEWREDSATASYATVEHVRRLHEALVAK